MNRRVMGGRTDWVGRLAGQRRKQVNSEKQCARQDEILRGTHNG